MSRTAAARAAIGADKPTTASILALVQSIETQPQGSPAAVAYRTALVRKGHEAHAAGGVQLLDDLLREVALADPAKGDARVTIVRAAWAGL